MTKKPNRADLTLRNLGPIKLLKARVKSMEYRQRATEAQLDEFRSRLDNLSSEAEQRTMGEGQ